MRIKVSNVIMLCVLVFSLAACTSKTTETAAETTTEQPARGERPGKGGKGGQGKAPQFSELLAKLDSDKDGRLSRTEVQGPLKNEFDNIDTDNDGFITEAEFKNMPAPQRGQR